MFQNAYLLPATALCHISNATNLKDIIFALMDKGYEEKYHLMELNHWWYTSRRRVILDMISTMPRHIRILDIGCSGGALITDLKAAGFTQIKGIDFSQEAIDQCKRKGLTDVFVMDAHFPDFPESSFDLIIASDCLEHLEKDNVALANWNKILAPGGRGLIFVPAFMSLWSEHDVVNHHFRRYTRAELKQKSLGAGFHVSKASYWNFAMFFPAWIYRKIRSASKSAETNPEDHMDKFSPVANSILKGWMKLENAIFRSLGFPLGVSVMVDVKRK